MRFHCGFDAVSLQVDRRLAPGRVLVESVLIAPECLQGGAALPMAFGNSQRRRTDGFSRLPRRASVEKKENSTAGMPPSTAGAPQHMKCAMRHFSTYRIVVYKLSESNRA